MFKKIFILFLTSFLLFSCWETTTKSVSEENKSWLILHEQEWFTLFVPSNWYSLTWSLLERLPTPAIGDISFALSSKDSVGGFSNNLIILSQDLPPEGMSSYDYSVFNNPSIKKNFSYFKNIKEKDIKFINLDWVSSKLYIYEAKYSKQTPSLNFLQTAVVCKNKWYLITIWLSKENISFIKYENILKTFSCK